MITTLLTIALMFVLVLSPALIPATVHAVHALSNRRPTARLAIA